MQLVSRQFTQVVKAGTKKGRILTKTIPPGTPFDLEEGPAREKVAAGRAEPYAEEAEEAPAAVTSPSEADPAAQASSPQANGDGQGAGAGQEDGEGGDENTITVIQDAMMSIDPDDNEAFLEDGRPKVGALNEALGEALGRPVTAEERDEAWTDLQG